MTMTPIDITQYATKLEYLAIRLKKRHELGLEVRELMQAGYEALQRLANSGEYDSTRGEFWTWAYKHVLNRMIKEVSVHNGHTRRQRAALRANRDARARATARPTAELTRPTSEPDDREHFMQRWAVVDGTAVGYQLELEEAEAPTAEEQLLAAERKQLDDAAIERLLASIQRLPERYRSMFLQRYVDEAELNTVAGNFGISKSRACHLLRKTRERLRLAMESGLELEPEP